MGKKFTRGTTLIELVVAMAVTTIVLSSVTALSIFAYSASFSFSKKTVVTNNLNGLKNYLRQFVDNNNGTFLKESVNINYGPDDQRCFVTKVNNIETTYSYKGSEFKTSEEVLYNSRYDFILGIESLNEDLYKFSFRYGTINEYILLNIYKVG